MKIAFVSPWYGTAIPGGAEAETRRTAEHLSRVGLNVEILTTCVREFRADWNRNYHPPGLTTENGVPVRRFRVRRRDTAAFDSVNGKLMHGQAVSRHEEQTYIRESVRSRALEKYIADHINDYLFVFIPYMFGTTYWGIRACRGTTLLIPCLHNEVYARMHVFRDMFRSVDHALFHTRSEAKLAETLYGLDNHRSILMGEGVDTDWQGNESDFRAKYSIEKPFILYAGRKDPGKNVGELIDLFRAYRKYRNSDIELVLIGGGELPRTIQKNEGIRDLGFVPVQDKYDAYAAATLFCQPSVQESFSLVLMESWVAETPTLVNANCTVTKEHCVCSNGGLAFRNYPEFAACVDVLLSRPKLRVQMGRNGRKYVLDNYHWDRIVRNYQNLFDSIRVRFAS